MKEVSKDMKAVVLAGGFAKRMWPLTKNKPKHLLPVAGKPMLDFVMEKLERVQKLDEILVSTNQKFKDNFERYLAERDSEKTYRLFIEDTDSEDEKLGSVGALGYLIREKTVEDEMLVIGGDNIFEFELTDLIDYFRTKKGNVVALYDVKSKAKAMLYGIVTLDSANRIVGFEEKPDDPHSTLASTACYVFTKKGVRNILRYLDEGNTADKMGHFIEWLYRNDEIFGFVFEGAWFDIGSLKSYSEANQYLDK